jgi:hypothetical protein
MVASSNPSPRARFESCSVPLTVRTMIVRPLCDRHAVAYVLRTNPTRACASSNPALLSGGAEIDLWLARPLTNHQ